MELLKGLLNKGGCRRGLGIGNILGGMAMGPGLV